MAGDVDPAPLRPGSVVAIVAALSRRSRLTLSATSGHTPDQEIAMPVTGFRVQPPSGDGHSNAPILQSCRSRTCSAGRHPMPAIGPQFNQPTRRSRPLADARSSEFTARQLPLRSACALRPPPRTPHAPLGAARMPCVRPVAPTAAAQIGVCPSAAAADTTCAARSRTHAVCQASGVALTLRCPRRG